MSLYIDQKCIFCSIASGDSHASIVYDDGDIIAFDDIDPIAPVHVLVVPVSHISKLIAFDNLRDSQLLGHLMTVAGRIALEKGVDKSGYRLVLNQGPHSGQMVDHLHIHLIGGRNLGPLT